MPRSDAALPKRAYTIEEAIEVSPFSRNRIYTLIAEGRLKTFTHGRRRFVSARALDACIALLEAETEHAEAA